MDFFIDKNISPMLLEEEKEPFDDENYIFELKLDGIRAIAYLEKDGQDRIERDLGSDCKITHWSSRAIDIIPAGGGKARGMEYFMRKLGFLPSETMAFGDAENDIDMLKYAGIGVAMGNAEERVRYSADYVTERADQDGIRRALEHFHMIREENC